MSQIASFSLEEALEKNKKLKKSDIESLRQWCQKEPHLPKISESSLVLFLHTNDYRIEPTKIKIEQYYTLRSHLPEFFSIKDTFESKDLSHIFNITYVLPLKQTTKEGYHVLLIKLMDTDASKYVFKEYIKHVSVVIDLWLYQVGTMDGHIVIFDFEGVSLGHATRINPLDLKRHLFYIQEGLPLRLKQIHFLNAHVETIIKMMRPFMRKESLEMMHVHPNLKSLKKFFSIEILPNELGGKAGPLMELHRAQINQIENHRNWFLEEESRSQVDESKRIGKPKTVDSIFGVEGNFKKIDFD